MTIDITALAERALNAACTVIQAELGVTSGDVAGHFFSDDSMLDPLRRYIRTELAAQDGSR